MFNSEDIYEKINDLRCSKAKRQVCQAFTVYYWDDSRKWDYKVVHYAGGICMYQLFYKGVIVFEKVKVGNEVRSLYFNADHVSDAFDKMGKFSYA